MTGAVQVADTWDRNTGCWERSLDHRRRTRQVL